MAIGATLMGVVYFFAPVSNDFNSVTLALAVSGIGAAFSPKLVGHLLDSSGNYSMTLLLCAACTVAGADTIAYQPKA